MIIRTILTAGFVLLSLNVANALGTPECYATFPGAQGKKCCDASFAKNARVPCRQTSGWLA